MGPFPDGGIEKKLVHNRTADYRSAAFTVTAIYGAPRNDPAGLGFVVFDHDVYGSRGWRRNRAPNVASKH